MTNKESISRPSSSGQSAEGTSAPLSSLPDINAETYPFELVQHLLDQAAYFNIFSIPDPQFSAPTIAAPSNHNGAIGFLVNEVLHRFEVLLEPPTPATGLRTINVVGEPMGRFTHRWMLIPHNFQALPDQEPPPTLFDSTRSQRFVMLDGVCRFGDGQDGFHGFGTGLTLPMTVNGRSELLAAAVGDITEGFGKFKGHEGTYTYCGTISPNRGFLGNLLIRVMDMEGTLRAEGTLPALEPRPDPEPGITYIIFRGQKKDRTQKTTYRFGPDGQVMGLNVIQQLRLLHLDFISRGREGLRSVQSVGPVIGKMTAKIDFNLLNPGAPGTRLSPIPFQSYNEYTFFDREGQTIGSFAADGSEGRTFNMKLLGAPGQVALRFGGFGPLMNGAGCFSGIQGLMTDNSVVGIAPHTIATLYVLRINDPDGKYRLALK